MKKILFGIITLALVAMVLPSAYAAKPDNTPNNGKSHNKATGEVVWTARTNLPEAQQLPGLITMFNAHDIGDGMEDKGTLESYRPSDPGFEEGTVVVDLVCVNVQGDDAWFAGEAVEGTGDYADVVGDVYLYWVMDGSTPGAEADKIGGRSYPTLEQACDVVEAGGWTGTGDVTDGNLVVHYSE